MRGFHLRVAQLQGQGGSSMVVTAWFWSTLWKDCYQDSTALVNCVDFRVLWTLKRVYSHDKMIHFYVWFITTMWHITVFVISLHTGSQGAPGDRPLPWFAHHSAYSAHTSVEATDANTVCWWWPLLSICSAVSTTSQNIYILAGLVSLPLGVISLFSCRCIRPGSLLFIHKQSGCIYMQIKCCPIRG